MLLVPSPVSRHLPISADKHESVTEGRSLMIRMLPKGLTSSVLQNYAEELILNVTNHIQILALFLSFAFYIMKLLRCGVINLPKFTEPVNQDSNVGSL